jgi:hypothetical protein
MKKFIFVEILTKENCDKFQDVFNYSLLVIEIFIVEANNWECNTVPTTDQM